jgi:hypothetical protein
VKAGSPRARGRADWKGRARCERFPLVLSALLAGILVAIAPSVAAAEWQPFSAGEDGFSAEFPVEPAFRDVAEMKSEAIVFFHDYRAVTEAGVFLVDVVRFTPAVRAARTDDELLDIAVDAVAGNDCEASEPREVQAAASIAHEATFRCPDELTMRARFRIADEWLYQVGAGGGPGFADGPDAARFIDSFRLVAE